MAGLDYGVILRGAAPQPYDIQADEAQQLQTQAQKLRLADIVRENADRQTLRAGLGGYFGGDKSQIGTIAQVDPQTALTLQAREREAQQRDEEKRAAWAKIVGRVGSYQDLQTAKQVGAQVGLSPEDMDDWDYMTPDDFDPTPFQAIRRMYGGEETYTDVKDASGNIIGQRASGTNKFSPVNTGRLAPIFDPDSNTYVYGTPTPGAVVRPGPKPSTGGRGGGRLPPASLAKYRADAQAAIAAGAPRASVAERFRSITGEDL